VCPISVSLAGWPKYAYCLDVCLDDEGASLLINSKEQIFAEKLRWVWWARHIYYNRYIPAPKTVYQDLLKLVQNKDYFVITTNVDHQFQRAGFDKKRLFYTQGDYGLFQSVNPKIRKTYDNETWVIKAMKAMPA